MRDHKGVPLNIDTVRLSFELRSIWKVSTKRVFEVRDPISGETTDIPVPEMPEDLIYPLQAYLGELPSYDMSLRLEPAEDRGAVEAARLRPVLLHRTPSRRSGWPGMSNEDSG